MARGTGEVGVDLKGHIHRRCDRAGRQQTGWAVWQLQTLLNEVVLVRVVFSSGDGVGTRPGVFLV